LHARRRRGIAAGGEAEVRERVDDRTLADVGSARILVLAAL
jgi:hypothetical protein